MTLDEALAIHQLRILDVPTNPCVGSGFCCKQSLCPFGEPDDAGVCRFLLPWEGDELLSERYRCAAYERIKQDPSSVVSPAFGTGCCSTTNRDRRQIMNEIMVRIRSDVTPPGSREPAGVTASSKFS